MKKRIQGGKPQNSTTCYENTEDDKNVNGDGENKQESKNPEDDERKVGPGTPRNTEEPQGIPPIQTNGR